MGEVLHVAVIDDHPLFREGVVRSLEEAGGFEIVGQGGSADDAVRLAGEQNPHIILLDISMPGDGLAAARRVNESAPEVRIVMLTVSEAGDDIMAALKEGAKGYILKGIGSSMLADILCAIANGESYVSPSLAARLLVEMRNREAGEPAEDPLSSLSRREEEILRLVAVGLSNKEVGLKLDLQEKTVKHHMTRILNKLRVRNRTEAAMFLRDAKGR
jgi:two-component system nitrate/nitrite response regulator NarL